MGWATWIGSCGDWREWACSKLGVEQCADDIFTGRYSHTGEPVVDEHEDQWRAQLNEPATYQALRHHWETVVLPAFRKAGVR